MSYGDRLKDALTHAKKSRRELADAIGQSVQSIGMVIAGKSDKLSTAASAKAATFLRVDHNWLVSGRGSMVVAAAPEPIKRADDLLAGPSPDAAYVAHWIDKIKNQEVKERVAHACVALVLLEIDAPARPPTPEPDHAARTPGAASRAR